MPDIMPHEFYFQTVATFWQSRAIVAAVEFELADILANGPMAVAGIATRAQANLSMIFRLLRALESIGIFQQVSRDTFANTPTSEVLRKDVPGSMHGWILTHLGNGHGQYEGWSGFMHTVKTGESGFERVHNQTYWNFLQNHPESEAQFNRTMTEATAVMTPAVTNAYPWSRFSTIADIGGGIGTQLRDILAASPSSRGILFDRPGVASSADVHPRIRTVGGDFFQNIPAGADAYLLRFILHDWSDEDAKAILRSTRKAVSDKARLVIVEMIVPDGPEFALCKWSDLLMGLLFPGARERGRADFEALLNSTGFALDDIVATESPVSLLVAKPV